MSHIKTLNFEQDKKTLTVSTDANSQELGQGGAYIPGLDLNFSIPLPYDATIKYIDISQKMMYREFKVIEILLHLIISGCIPYQENIIIDGMPFWEFIRSKCEVKFYTDNQTIVRIYNNMILGQSVYIHANDTDIDYITIAMKTLLNYVTFTIVWTPSHKEDYIHPRDQTTEGWGNAIADSNCNGFDHCTIINNIQYNIGSICRDHHVNLNVPTTQRNKDIYYAMNPHLYRMPSFNLNLTATNFTI